MTDRKNLSDYGKMYCDFLNNLLNQYSNDSFMLCGDFNFNPHLISSYDPRYLDHIPHNNSLLFNKINNIPRVTSVTVDGVLLSRLEKQKFYSGLNHGLFKLSTDRYFLQSNNRKHLEEEKKSDLKMN